jgi:hypothetical protein
MAPITEQFCFGCFPFNQRLIRLLVAQASIAYSLEVDKVWQEAIHCREKEAASAFK